MLNVVIQGDNEHDDNIGINLCSLIIKAVHHTSTLHYRASGGLPPLGTTSV